MLLACVITGRDSASFLAVASWLWGKGLRTLGVNEQAVRLPTIATHAKAAQKGLKRSKGNELMGLILLEALLAGLVFVLIVWWTMFSGRKNGELPRASPDKEDEKTEKKPD